ncbi:MAG: FdtA/QdtA family cupin domain-containing protein [Parcubacteria group bacterium]
MRINRLSNKIRLKVKNSGIVKLASFNDYPDGNLYIAESGRNMPFKIKRIYYINALGNSKAIRGKHAHKKLDELLFCINGSFVLDIDDGRNKQSILIDDPSYGIRIKPGLWITMHSFSQDCVLLALANDFFKESDYIRDYQKFLEFIDNKK